MVRVTEQATTALRELLTANHAPPEDGVRLTPNGEGSLGMVVDAPHAGDEVIRHNETPVLIVDAAVAGQLTEMVVDYESVEDDHQTPGGFVLRPNEK
jgi:Fe-S cluster assembly iron-binding protein IscA